LKEGIDLAVGCAFCGEEVAGSAGCSVVLSVAPGIKLGQVWLPLCTNDAHFVASYTRHDTHPDRLSRTWEITCVHDGERWTIW
jgi:hypothetical protein